MERAAEWFALVSCLIVGLSHVLHPRGWAGAFVALHRLGKPGAFANGGLSLLPGAALVATHPAWSGPAAVLTLLGWLLVLKGSICFLAPGVALRGMGKAGAGDGREFVLGGLMLLAVAGALGFVLWGVRAESARSRSLTRQISGMIIRRGSGLSGIRPGFSRPLARQFGLGAADVLSDRPQRGRA